MKALIFLSFLAFGLVFCDEYLDDNHCEKGPTFWCTNLHYAKKCGAVKHCTDTVWTKQIVNKVDREASCTVCQLMVNNARQLLKNKATEEETSNLLAKACHIMPSNLKRSQCKDAIKNHLVDILTLIKKEDMSSQMVCSLIGLCLGTEPKLPEKEAKTGIQIPVGDKYCDDCTNFMNDIREIVLSNKTQDDVEQALYMVCKRLGPFQGICRVFVDEYVPALFQYLANEFNVSEICSVLMFCRTQENENVLNRFKQIINMKSVEECKICKEVITEVRNYDRNPQFQSMLMSFVEDKLCPMLGQSEALCKQYVKSYGPVLFELLASELDPEKLCTEIDICPGTSEPEVLTASLPINTMVKSSNAQTKPTEPKQAVQSGPGCVLCEFVLTELEKELSQNTSRAEIEQLLEKVCDLLPSTIRTECDSFVQTYTEIIVELLLADVKPKEVCTRIGLCNGTEIKNIMEILKSKPVIIKKVSDSPVCDACEEVVTYIDELLKANVTIQDVEMILDRICDLLPQTIKKECDTIVSSYGPYILQLLSELADPQEVCQKIKLCPSPSQKDHVLRFKPQMVGVKKCTFGPSYWCASRENAKECGAIEHCEKHVWNH